MSTALNLADALVLALTPLVGSVRNAAAALKREKDIAVEDYRVWPDFEGEQLEFAGKRPTKESAMLLLGFGAPVNSYDDFKACMARAEQLQKFVPENGFLNANGVSWTHDGPNRWIQRYNPDLLTDDEGTLTGVFLSYIAVPFVRWL